MRYTKLGHSDVLVSAVCLGTMTFGEQNSEADAHNQLDCALAHGINFIDTAEMYPVPVRAETYGTTERYVGSWLKHQARDRLVIATKAAGPGRGLEWVRNPLTCDAAQIVEAAEASLKRLQTDYIDLYQLHWPARTVPKFGTTLYEPMADEGMPSIHEQLTGLAKLVDAGKVRYVGLSNETPWGVTEFVRLAAHYGLPRVQTLQNACSLVNRTFENGLAEVCHREQVGLLAYSVLGFGHLTGKYLDNPAAEGRVTRFPGFAQRYTKPNLLPAVQAYVDLARQHGLSPAHMAQAWVMNRWYVASTIVGATTRAQLEENIASLDVVLSEEVLARIEAIHLLWPNPAP